jgi:hypothetical protein
LAPKPAINIVRPEKRRVFFHTTCTRKQDALSCLTKDWWILNAFISISRLTGEKFRPLKTKT